MTSTDPSGLRPMKDAGFVAEIETDPDDADTHDYTTPYAYYIETSTSETNQPEESLSVNLVKQSVITSYSIHYTKLYEIATITDAFDRVITFSYNPQDLGFWKYISNITVGDRTISYKQEAWTRSRNNFV